MPNTQVSEQMNRSLGGLRGAAMLQAQTHAAAPGLMISTRITVERYIFRTYIMVVEVCR